MIVMEKIIDIDAHAFLRLLRRGEKYNLDYYETKERTFQTVGIGNLAKRKHLSGMHKTYYNYFKDNLSFYVICQEKKFKDYTKILIKTVIVEEGRE